MASIRRSLSHGDKEPIRYSKNWVVGTVTRMLHGCLIVNHDVFVHKSAYIGVYDPREWFAWLKEGDAIEFIAEEHIESKNRWRALFVRDPPSGYRRAGSSPPDMSRSSHGAPPMSAGYVDNSNMMMMMPPQAPEFMMENYMQPQAFYGPPQPMMVPPSVYYPPMFMPSAPGPYQTAPQPYFQPAPAPMPAGYQMYPQASMPMPMSASAGFPAASPPSPYLQPLPMSAAPCNPPVHPSPSPTPIIYAPEKQEMGRTTPHDLIRDTDTPAVFDEDDAASQSSSSSHSSAGRTERTESMSRAGSVPHPVSPQGEAANIPHATIKEADVQLLLGYLKSGNAQATHEALLQRPTCSPDFLTSALSVSLEPQYATLANVAKVKDLFLQFFSSGTFDQVHFQVAWIVAAYRLANGHSVDNQTALDLLAHALVHGYLEMDALRLIVAPLKSSHRAVPLVVGALANVLATTSEENLKALYQSSHFNFKDVDESVSEDEISQLLGAKGLSFLLESMTTIDGLIEQTAQATISV